MQNKKALVLAISAALAVPCAFAQKGGERKAWDAAEPDQIVELYGKVYPEVIRPSGSGATEAGTPVATFAGTPTGTTGIIRRTEMESSNSRLGVRGHEKLGPNLKAIFQLETEFHVDSNDSRFAQRDSFIGLAHRYFGTVKLGRMDTPFKSYGDDISFLGISSGNFTSTSNVFRKPGFGTSNASRFHERAQNMVDYESPEIGGLQGEVQYSTSETDTSTRHPHFWSGGIKWGAGPFEIAVAHEIHWDAFGGSSNVPTAMRNNTDQAVRSKDKATAVMVKYKLGRHQFEFDINEKRYNENATITGRFSSYKNRAWLAIWDARWSDAWRTQVHYVKAEKGECSRVNAACITDGLDGSQLSAGFAYYFSRRTYLFAMASWLKNGFSAQFNNSASQAPAIGEDITQYAVGLSHSF